MTSTTTTQAPHPWLTSIDDGLYTREALWRLLYLTDGYLHGLATMWLQTLLLTQPHAPLPNNEPLAILVRDGHMAGIVTATHPPPVGMTYAPSLDPSAMDRPRTMPERMTVTMMLESIGAELASADRINQSLAWIGSDTRLHCDAETLVRQRLLDAGLFRASALAEDVRRVQRFFECVRKIPAVSDRTFVVGE